METSFSHYKSMGKFELVRDFMHVLVTCKYKGSDQEQPRNGGDTIFPIISQWGLSVAMDTRVLIKSASKQSSLSQPPLMLHLKFDQGWPTGLRGIQV